MSRKRVLLVGTGPGGLAAGMLLASSGYRVEIFEKKPYLGGRTSSFTEKGFTFDLGPTFLMMKYILDEIFALTGRETSEYLTMKQIDPLYQLILPEGKVFLPSKDREKTLEQIRTLFPGNEIGFKKYLQYETVKFSKLAPCLQIPYSKYRHLLRGRLIKALPYLDAHISLNTHLAKFFSHPDLRVSFTFQSKYLGMSPWECPGLFSMISYIEHGMGIFHPLGGLNQLTKAMARVVEEEGGQIHLNTGVKEILVDKGKAVGLILDNGETVKGEHIVINADFAHAMTHLVKERYRPKFTDEALARKKYSCSTFMLYLGVDKVYDLPHHSIIFARDYKQNVDEISRTKVLSADPSFYVQNAIVTDPSLAPEGQSTIYVLVPVPNNFSGIEWEAVQADFREKIYGLLESRAGLTDLKKHVIYEKMITPRFWEDEAFVYKGATFNLAHNMGQMLLWRPHNEFEELEHCYLVGGGTHPGSGLPTIFESGRISAGLIVKKDLW